jgi:SNF2 family DNA or RNA helicase
MRYGIAKRYGYLWVTLALFLISIVGHWIFAWFAYVDEQLAHGEPVEVGKYLVEVLRDTLENWKSEFLQLMWQVAGLAFLWHIGSPQSKEGDDRKEEKIDRILAILDPEEGNDLIRRLDQKYPRK